MYAGNVQHTSWHGREYSKSATARYSVGGHAVHVWKYQPESVWTSEWSQIAPHGQQPIPTSESVPRKYVFTASSEHYENESHHGAAPTLPQSKFVCLGSMAYPSTTRSVSFRITDITIIVMRAVYSILKMFY